MTQYVQYVIWRLDGAYHNLESNERIVAKQQFLGTWESFQNKALAVSYALTGLRIDADILCVRISESLELLQDWTCRIQSSGMGKFLVPTFSYLAVAGGPRYAAKASGDGEFAPGQGRYLFLSPWARGPEWFGLSAAEREKAESSLLQAAKAGKVRLHPGLRGLEELDDLVAAEVDDPNDYLALAAALKQQRRDTHSIAGPTFAGVLKDIRDHVDCLG